MKLSLVPGTGLVPRRHGTGLVLHLHHVVLRVIFAPGLGCDVPGWGGGGEGHGKHGPCPPQLIYRVGRGARGMTGTL